MRYVVQKGSDAMIQVLNFMATDSGIPVSTSTISETVILVLLMGVIYEVHR
jgi:hypothetical protein